MRNAKAAPGWSAATSRSSVTPNKNSQLSRLSIESLIQPDVTLKPSAWLPPAVTNVPAPNRGVQTGRHFTDFYQTEFINSDSQDVWEQLPPPNRLHILWPETKRFSKRKTRSWCLKGKLFYLCFQNDELGLEFTDLEENVAISQVFFSFFLWGK